MDRQLAGYAAPVCLVFPVVCIWQDKQGSLVFPLAAAEGAVTKLPPLNS